MTHTNLDPYSVEVEELKNTLLIWAGLLIHREVIEEDVVKEILQESLLTVDKVHQDCVYLGEIVQKGE